MLVLRDPSLASSITDNDIRELVGQRFDDICDGDEYEADLHGFMIVVEAGDSVEALEKESGCPMLHNLYNDIRFGEPGFSPCFEVLEEHDTCYEMVFVPGGGDFGIVIFIPKQDGIDPELLAMCAEHAEPAP